MRTPEGARRLGFAGLLAAALIAGCSLVPFGQPEPIPTEDEARAFLAEIVTLARSGDFDGLCARGSTCRHDLDSAGRDTVPPDPPLIVGTRRIEHEQRRRLVGRRDRAPGLRHRRSRRSVRWRGPRVPVGGQTDLDRNRVLVGDPHRDAGNTIGGPRGPAPAGCPA